MVRFSASPHLLWLADRIALGWRLGTSLLKMLYQIFRCVAGAEPAAPQDEVQTPVHGVHASPRKAPAYLARLISSPCSLSSPRLTPAVP